MDELRTLFTLGADALHRVHQFREERLAEIDSGHNPRPLQGEGRLIIHIVPLVAVTSMFQVDLERAHQLHQVFRPMGATGMSPRFNFEGSINERGGDQNFGYTQIFRNGALEVTKASLIRERDGLRFIHGGTMEKCIFEVLSGYLNGLRDLDVPPPLVVLFTLEGVKGVSYRVQQSVYDDEYNPPIGPNILYLPDCIINEYGEDSDYHRAVKPAFDALWNSAGRVSAKTFSAEGVWIGNVRR